MNRNLIILILVAGIFFIGDIRTSSAQNLSDWQAASSAKGCESIPYSDYRDDCKDEQKEIDNH
jgi:hypothetical protein